MLPAVDVESRIQRLLDVRTDTTPLLDALAALQIGRKASLTASGSTESLRSNLRGGVEAASLRAVEAFIAAAAPVAAAVDALDAEAASLELAVHAASQRLAAAAESASGFATAMARLSDQRDQTATRLAGVSAFTAAHEVTALDEATLEAGPDEDDGGRSFFKAVGRLEAAAPRVQSLLGGAAHDLGMELTDSVAARTRSASERLFAWCLERCAQADAVVAAWDASAMATALAADEGMNRGSSAALQSSPAQSASLSLLELAAGAPGDDSSRPDSQRLDRRSTKGSPDAPRVLLFGLRYLSARAPAFLRSCQNAALPPLRLALSRRFMHALTGAADVDTHDSGSGSSRGVMAGASSSADSSRPLELSAHDPPRFCGDLLAWVHLALAEQAEALAGLFGPGITASLAANALRGNSSSTEASLPGDAGSRAEPAAASEAPTASEPDGDDKANKPLPLQGMLAAVSESLARPLGARLDAAALATRTGGPGAVSSGDSAGSSLGSGSGGSGSGAVAAAAAGVVGAFRVLDVICFYMELLSPSASGSEAAAVDSSFPAPATPSFTRGSGSRLGVSAAESSSSMSAKRRQNAALLPRDAPLMQRLAACRVTAETALRSALEAAGGAIASSRAALTSDLGGSALVASASLLLGDILRAVRGALTPASAAALPGGVDSILAALIPPVVAACRASAEGLRRADASVYMLNCLGALHAGLSAFAEPEAPVSSTPSGPESADPSSAGSSTPVRSWVRRLADEMGAWEEDLVRQAGNDQLAGAGLLPLLSALRAQKEAAAAEATPLSLCPGLSAADITHALSVFDRRVMALTTGSDGANGGGGDAASALPRLANPGARARVRSAVLAVLAAGYRRLHIELLRPESGYSAAVLAAARKPAEVDALLELPRTA